MVSSISPSGTVTSFPYYPPLTAITSFAVSPDGGVYLDALDAYTSVQGIYEINGQTGALTGALATAVPGFTEMQFSSTPEPSSISTATVVLATVVLWRRRRSLKPK
ncbi:MAG TPA: hypothetical protein VIY49_29125 [Bryobacteraceae bacterium]